MEFCDVCDDEFSGKEGITCSLCKELFHVGCYVKQKGKGKASQWMCPTCDQPAMAMEDSVKVLLARSAIVSVKMKKLASLRNDVMKNTSDIKVLQEKVEKLETDRHFDAQRISDLEQRSRINNIEIVGFPVTKDENTDDIVRALATAVEFDLSTFDIVSSHRVRSYDPKKQPHIICSLRDKKVKNMFLKSVRGFT